MFSCKVDEIFSAWSYLIGPTFRALVTLEHRHRFRLKVNGKPSSQLEFGCTTPAAPTCRASLHAATIECHIIACGFSMQNLFFPPLHTLWIQQPGAQRKKNSATPAAANYRRASKVPDSCAWQEMSSLAVRAPVRWLIARHFCRFGRGRQAVAVVPALTSPGGRGTTSDPDGPQKKLRRKAQ